MRVVVDRVHALESSDSADDIYIVVFRGNTTPPFSSNVAAIGPGNFWDDFDDGETWNEDETIAKWTPDAVHVVMLVEKDDGKDVSGSDVLGAWRAQTDLIWRSVMISHSTAGIEPGSEVAKKAGAAAIKNAFHGLASLYMEFPKGNDDIIGKVRRLVIEPGTPETLTFFSDSNHEDAHYRITFKVT